MAIYTAGIGTGYRLELEVLTASQSIANNTSTLSWSLKIVRTASSGAWSSWTDNRWTVSIGGQSFSGTTSYDFRSYTELALRSGQLTIKHAADGTASGGVEFKWDDHGGTALADGGGSGTYGVATIPRATVPTVDNDSVNAGNNVVISLPRASTSFYHTLVLHYGTNQYAIATNVQTGFNYSVPIGLLSNIPNSTSLVGQIRAITYTTGDVKIGEQRINFRINAGPTVLPTFGNLNISDANATVVSKIGAFVKNLSKLQVAITGAVGAYGSTIKSYRIETLGQGSVVSAASGTMPYYLNRSGVVTVKATVTDSRGRSFSRNYNINVLDYNPPKINSAVAQRSNTAGTVQELGTSVRVNLNAAVQSLTVASTQKNRLLYSIFSRIRGTTAWTTKISNAVPGGVSFNNFAVVSTYGVEDSYEVLIRVQDEFATSEVLLNISTATIFMHWDGKTGMGIGKFREQGMLDVAGDIYQKNGHPVDPIGTIVMYAGANAPAGWLICNGAAVSRTTYADLAAVIGITYGSGNGSTTFNIPDFRGRVPVGFDSTQAEFNSAGKTGGAKTHTLSVDEMPSHTHIQRAHYHDGIRVGTQAMNWTSAQRGPGSAATMAPETGTAFAVGEATATNFFAGGSGAHNNLQPYLTLTFIIKF